MRQESKRRLSRSAPVAKGKLRRTEIIEDEQRLAEDEQRILSDVRKGESRAQHRDEVEASQVVNIWGDEIQAVYEEMGGAIDVVNAQDKALTLYREAIAQSNFSAREQEISYSTCKEHQ